MFRRLAVPIAAALLLAACGGGDDASDAPADAPTTTSASSDGDAGTATGTSAALQFSAPLVGGGQIDLSELGDKPVLLWFWAPW